MFAAVSLRSSRLFDNNPSVSISRSIVSTIACCGLLQEKRIRAKNLAQAFEKDLAEAEVKLKLELAAEKDVEVTRNHLHTCPALFNGSFMSLPPVLARILPPPPPLRSQHLYRTDVSLDAAAVSLDATVSLHITTPLSHYTLLLSHATFVLIAEYQEDDYAAADLFGDEGFKQSERRSSDEGDDRRPIMVCHF